MVQSFFRNLKDGESRRPLLTAAKECAAFCEVDLPLHYKQIRVYTDVKHRRWRLYSRPGDAVEKSLHWSNYSSPSVCWNEVVAELRRPNP